MGSVDEPALTFRVDSQTSIELYPLAPGDKLSDPHQDRTWPGPGIAVLIQRPDATELRYYGVSDEGLWRFLRKGMSVAERNLTKGQRRRLASQLGEGLSEEES